MPAIPLLILLLLATPQALHAAHAPASADD